MKKPKWYSKIIYLVVALGLVFSFTLMPAGASATAASELYAGGSNPGYVYKYVGGTAWQVISPSLGYAVLDLVEYDGHLYAGTTSSPTSGVGKVWRYDGGFSWTLVGDNMDDMVSSLAVYQGDLYAGTAWNGMKLYKYGGGTTWTQLISPIWSGTRALHVSHGYLLMGDIGMDYFGRWDGTNFYADLQGGGSCIWDYEDYDGKVYASAYQGRMWQSPDATNWSVLLGTYDGDMWELETFQDQLYMSYDNGELRASSVPDRGTLVYNTTSDGIISMTTDGDNLYFGTGGEAGYYGETSGTASVYKYDGTNVVLISDVDEMVTGVQVLYYCTVTEFPGTTTWGGNPTGVLVRETKWVYQNVWDPYANDIQIRLWTVSANVTINGWEVTISNFTSSNSVRDGNQAVNITASGANITNCTWVEVEVKVWLPNDSWECPNELYEAVTWTKDGVPKACPASGWEFDWPTPDPHNPGQYLHPFCVTNADTTDNLTITGLAFNSTMDWYDNLMNVTFPSPYPNFTLAPNQSWYTNITTTGPLYGGHIYFRYNITVSQNITLQEWKDHPVTGPTGSLATLQGNVTFLGRFSPPQWIEPFVVKLFEPGNLTNELWNGTATTNNTGVFTMSCLTPGTYDVGIKNWTCLSEVVTNVTLTGGNTTVVDFGTTREGDANNDDWITCKDRYLLYASWGMTVPPANPHCDFNRDGWVNAMDLNLLSWSWRLSGDLPSEGEQPGGDGWGFEIQPNMSRVLLGCGENFTVNITAVHYSGDANCWAMYLLFNTTYLDITGIDTPSTLPNGEAPIIVMTEWNNTAGWAQIGYGTTNIFSYINETFVHCTIHFRAKSVNGTSYLNFTWLDPRHATEITCNTTAHLNWSCVVNGTVEVTSSATLEGHVSYLSRYTPPNATWAQPFVVRAFEPGNLTNELWNGTATTNNTGVFTMSCLTPGTYDIGIKNCTALSELETNVTLTGGNTTVVDFGTTREGDSDGNDAVTGMDFSILNGAFESTPADLNWNANCDFNRNGAVTGMDFSLLNGNFEDVGPLYGY